MNAAPPHDTPSPASTRVSFAGASFFVAAPAAPHLFESEPPSNLATLLSVRHDWWDQAACRDSYGSLGRLFFSDDLADIAQAKQLCATCPVLSPCLEGALERREPGGVWGGQLFHKGQILVSKRPRGRPPKNPRPDDQLPQVPVPSTCERPPRADHPPQYVVSRVAARARIRSILDPSPRPTRP